jgi:hypothetical protein
MNADFESQLQRQPLRELPRDWRAEILAAASGLRDRGEGATLLTDEDEVGRAVLCPPRRARSARPTSSDGISTWPSLRAWAALAAVWLVIFLLHVAAPDEPRLARNSPAMTLQSFARLHEQTLMMAQFPSQTDVAEPPVAPPSPPKPRSEMPRKQLIG